MPEREPDNNSQHEGRDEIAQGPARSNILGIQDVEVSLLKQAGKQVVGCDVNRLSKVGENPPENAVRIEQVDPGKALPGD